MGIMHASMYPGTRGSPQAFRTRRTERGEQRLFPLLRADEGKSGVCAPGFSCRHQILDGVQLEAKHPAVLIAEQLAL